MCYWCQERMKTGRHGDFCARCYKAVHRICLAEVGITAKEYCTLMSLVHIGLVSITDSGYSHLAQIDRLRPKTKVEYTELCQVS